MADTATAAVVETPPAPAPASAPVSGAPPSVGTSESAPAPAPEGGGSDGAADGPAIDPHVPWAKFRSVQTTNTQLRRQMQEAESRYQAELDKIRQDMAGVSRYREDYQALEEILRAHPDLAEQLYERVQGKTTAVPKPTMALPPEITSALEKVGRLEERFLQQERHHQVLSQDAADRALSEQLNQQLSGLMKTRGYPETLLPDARSYVLSRVNDMPDLTLDDVPYLFGEWFKMMEQARQTWTGGMVQGKRADLAASPPMPGGSPGAPITERTEPGRNDGRTKERLEQMLRERLGWGDGG